MRVLLADDESSIRVTLGDDLRAAGHDVAVVADGLAAWELAQKESFDCLITDIMMPRLDGIELHKRMSEKCPATSVVLITAYGSIDSAVDAMKRGAADYITKPFMNDQILIILQKIDERNKLRDECRRLREQLQGRFSFHNIVGKSRQMQAVFDLVQSIAKTDASVLIDGESGTGKELVAQAIHYNSPRKEKTLVKMSCSVFPESLIEDELFGHEKGSFTDAREQKIGRFEQANGGTIFIDDIDDMSPNVQQKLLRVLQEREFERIGGTRTIKLDIRIVAATKRNLFEAVEEKTFREDLFYRLNVVTMKLPPLREREGDIPLLLSHFIRLHGKSRQYEVEPDTLYALQQYSWPGNVREFENSVERAIALAGDGNVLKKEHLISPYTRSQEASGKSDNPPTTLRDLVQKTEAEHIRKVLAFTAGHKGDAANLLGVTRKCLWEKMKQFDIQSK
jgi:two-component system response regulator PilR (NtrC family)